MSNVNFLSINDNNQLRDLHNYLKQKVTITINKLHGSAWVDNLITNQQALIPA